MTREEVQADYFAWLCDIVCGNIYAREISFKKLLSYLHEVDFTWSIPLDENRAEDGISLRYRFARLQVHEDLVNAVADMLIGSCSVLEMMVALAIRCEEDIMDDTAYGDRTRQWFWNMIASLGLGLMTDDRFDRHIVEDIIQKFLHHRYEPNGKGGLFTVRNSPVDLRTVEIHVQQNHYLNSKP